MPQIGSGASCRVGLISHDPFPEDPVELSGVDPVFPAEVEALGLRCPPGGVLYPVLIKWITGKQQPAWYASMSLLAMAYFCTMAKQTVLSRTWRKMCAPPLERKPLSPLHL